MCRQGRGSRLAAAVLAAAGLWAVGQVQAQVQGPQAKVLAPPAGLYQVKPGDTLWGLSEKYLESSVQWPELQRRNAVPVPERMQVGQWLVLGSSAAVLHATGHGLLVRKSGEEQSPATGTPLEPGDLLSTGRDGFLTVGFMDGSRVVIPSSSVVRVVEANGRQTRLELVSGEVESYVEKKQREREFEIRTRTFALGVKGTHFRARADGGTQTLEVLEGRVQATELEGARRSVEVSALEGLPLHAADGVLAVRGLLPPPPQRAAYERNEVEVQPVAGAAAYRLQLASDPDFLRMAAESRAPAPRFALLSLPEKLGTGFYHTRISAIDAQGVEGRPSEGVTFVAPAQAPAATGARPAGNGQWDIRWTTRERPRHTVFELASAPDFATPLVAVSGVYAGGVTVGPLEEPGRYYWRTREQAEGESLVPIEWGGSFEIPPP